MSKIKTAINLLGNDPKKILWALGRKNVFNWMPDKLYLRMIYYGEIGRKLNLNNPVTYNEKLQWLKLYDRRPEYTVYADKYAMREYIKHTIGEQYLIPLIGVYDKVEDIPWEELPEQFVLKCTHGSGCNIICNNKSTLNIKESKRKLYKWMKTNWFWSSREWLYKYVKPRIICEKFMLDESGTELKDYKIMCFNGEPKCSFVCLNRHLSGLNVDFYDMEWKPLPFELHYPRSGQNIKRPVNYEKMIEFSKMFAKDIPFVRVDFYEVDQQLYIGEITLFPASGLMEFRPENCDELLGSWLKLPIS